MSILSKIFGRQKKPPKGAYGRLVTLNGREVFFPRFSGAIYEEQKVRAAIDAIARHMSKLQVTFQGAAKPEMVTALKRRPNAVQTWSQFFYRAATIYYNDNNLILIPIEDARGTVTGIFPVLMERCEFVTYNGDPWLRYTFANGERAAIELERVGIMTRFQYKDDLRGESNSPLGPTMDLIGIQKAGIKEGVKNSATYKLIARLSNFTSDEDLANTRKRFTENNLKADAENGGVLLLPNTWVDAKQVEMKPYIADADTVKQIDESVNEYFGVNEKILKNEAVGDEWSAFYEGAIETFAIQFSEVVTDMLYSPREQTFGAKVMATTNRLQYMSTKDKLEVTTQLVDRGIMSINDALSVWNLPPIAGGDVRMIRGEYVNFDERSNTNAE